MREFDDLYKTTPGTKSWIHKVSTECREWCQALAADILEREQEPVWQNVHRAIQEQFPDDAPKAPDTIRAAIRSLVR